MNLPSQFRVVGPTYEGIILVDGTLLTCERHADGRLVNCQINNQPVTPQQYVDRKDAWRDTP